MVRGIEYFEAHGVAVLKITCILSFALSVPWLCIYKGRAITVPSEQRLSLGIEECTDTMIAAMIPHDGVSTCRAGLIVDVYTYITAGRAHIELLRKKGVQITTVCILDDGISYVYPPLLDDITVISIKKDQYALLSNVIAADLDCIMLDVQEIGFTPYDGALVLATLEAAHAIHKPVIIFDRPNMLGASVEGFGVGLGSRARIPIRHGMTLGEFATFCNQHIVETPIALHVVPMKHYQRFVVNPDLSNRISHYCMQGFMAVIQEIKPFQVRISADHRYHCVMLPIAISRSKRMWRELGMRLKAVGIDAKIYEYSNESTQQAYRGLNLAVANMHHFSMNGALLIILRFFTDIGMKLSYSERLRDMIGIHAVQAYLAGSVTEKAALHTLEHEALLFFDKASGSFLYQPLPKIML